MGAETGSMSGEVRPSIIVNSWEDFETLFIDRYPPGSPEHTRIGDAYRTAKYAHRGDLRADEKTKYFSHPREVAGIAMSRYGIYDPAMIEGLLLHDVPEDTDMPFPKVYRKRSEGDVMYPNSQWRRESHRYLSSIVSEEGADIAIGMTKPHVDGVEILDKSQVVEMYLEQLEEGGPKLIVAKMLDILHNMETLRNVDEDGQRKQVYKVIALYGPLFAIAEASEEWGEVAVKIHRDIKRAIWEAQSGWENKSFGQPALVY